MSTDNTVTQEDLSERDVKTTLAFPGGLWKEVKKAAIDANKTAQQFVIDTMAEKVGLKNAA